MCAHGKYLLSQNENDEIEYERLRRETKKMIRRSKTDFEIYIVNKTKSNPKDFYTYVRTKKVITTNIDPLHLDNGKETNAESEIAEVLNNYFASIFKRWRHLWNPGNNCSSTYLIPLSDCEFIEATVTMALDKIKVNIYWY